MGTQWQLVVVGGEVRGRAKAVGGLDGCDLPVL